MRKIARHVGEIIGAFPVGDPGVLPAMQDALARYAEAIRPWAETEASRMVAEVARKDEQVWAARSREMARALRLEVKTAPTGAAMRKLLAEQVTLITSLPTDAGQRVHRLTMEGLTKGSRASELAAEIMRSGEVTQSRANLIARTETSRTAAILTQVRAEHIGSTGYIWRTSRDGDVRPSHKKMEGMFVRWDAPPTLDGMIGQAGCLPNCRCYAEVVIPEA